MHRRAFSWLVWALVPLSSAAQAPDTGPDSAACAEGLSQLQAREQRAAGQPRGAAASELKRLRQQAARACLGGEGAAAPPPQAVLQAPLQVPSPPPAVVPLTPPWPTVPPAPATPPVRPPPSVTSCHAGGCWNSEGVFMPRVGPGVLGPDGVCQVQPGGGVQCP